MWDLISLIDYQFEAWKSTLWDKIDTEDLMQLIKEMQTKQCNPQSPQNKDIKNWKAFMALNERVRNMNTILPLISQLHSKFMQDRHWKKLMVITDQNIEFKSPNFCLDDLIKLQLYKYADEVNELVDGAQKEAKIEAKLNIIQEVWQTQNFTFKEYKEIPVLGSMEEIVEFVETHSMELMGMMSSKDVEEFKDRVMGWQKTLKTVDQVIQIWVKVQRNWQRLEPIFLESEDIRAQLPDDSRRFESIDAQFKTLMAEAREEPGVVTACTFEGREELLNTFFTEIELCEKALNEYLEQKKKIFARFYFVSNQALLDILSNGNNPEKVDEYLGDCFDGMKSLRFVKGPKSPSK
jgi:dynein heavy chain